MPPRRLSTCEPIRVVSDSDGDHALYGVQEPSQDKSAVGDQGVGTLVNIKDEAGTNLVNVIIGKPVKGQEGQRYIRRVNQSRVYVAAIDPTKLPAKFEDWIEKDLLNVNAWDISKLQLKDYTFQVAQTLQGPVTDFEQRLEITLTDDNGTWKLDQLLEARDGQMQPTQLLEGEELNTDRINALKDALDSLEIVDVQRKPQGLGEDLRADKGFFSDQAGVDSLVERGFYPVQISGDAIELLSTDGEVLATTKEGVEYVLRFGRVAGVDTESEEGKLKRFLLVSARVDQSQFPEPVSGAAARSSRAAARARRPRSQSSATQTLTRFTALQNSDAAVEPAPTLRRPRATRRPPSCPRLSMPTPRRRRRTPPLPPQDRNRQLLHLPHLPLPVKPVPPHPPPARRPICRRSASASRRKTSGRSTSATRSSRRRRKKCGS